MTPSTPITSTHAVSNPRVNTFSSSLTHSAPRSRPSSPDAARRPSEDRHDRVRRRLSTILVSAVVPYDRAVRRFALDGEAVGRDEPRGYHSERAKALREDVRLYILLVILRYPDQAAR